MKAEGQFISYYQVSYKNLGNRDYIFQRTSDGLWTDARLYEMLPQVKTVDCRGAVHNFRPDKDWAEQATLFLALSSGEGFNVLCGDYESGVLDEKAAKDFWCFLCRLEEQRPTKKVIFYTTIYKLRDNLMVHQGKDTVYGKIDWEHFELWLAQYPVIKNADGTTRLVDGFDVQKDSPYLSISSVVVRKKPPKFWQYWADGNCKGAEFGCGSRDTNLDVTPMTIEECNEFFAASDTTPPVGDCQQFEERLSTVEGSIVNLYDFNNARMQDVMNIERSVLNNSTKIADLQVALSHAGESIQKNDEAIEGLAITVVDNHNNIAANDADIDTAFERINGNTEDISTLWEMSDTQNALGITARDDIVKLKAADLLLDVKVKGLTEGQLEIVEDVIAVEDNLKDIANNQSEIYSEIERIDSDINGLEGGHTHPKWMYTLGLAK